MQRLFLFINIVLITAASFLSVDTAYKILAAQLTPAEDSRPPLAQKQPRPAEFKIPPLSRYRTIIERNIFHSKTNSPVTVQKTNVENIKTTERNLKLWGTVVGSDPAKAYAIIEESGVKSSRLKKQALYKRGDIVQGAKIKQILREKVILSADGSDEILRIAKRQSSGRTRRIQSAYNRPGSRPIRQRRTLRSSQIQKALGDINTVMSQANIRPHSEGFQITRIRPASIFRRLGLRNGDIITAVNDRPIQSAGDAMEIWQDLTARGETSISLKRRGRTRIIDYRVR